MSVILPFLEEKKVARLLHTLTSRNRNAIKHARNMKYCFCSWKAGKTKDAESICSRSQACPGTTLLILASIPSPCSDFFLGQDRISVDVKHSLWHFQENNELHVWPLNSVDKPEWQSWLSWIVHAFTRLWEKFIFGPGGWLQHQIILHLFCGQGKSTAQVWTIREVWLVQHI